MNIYPFRRVPCPRSPSPVEVVTPCRRWIQIKRVFAHWAQTTDKGRQNWGDTRCLRFSQRPMGKKRSKPFHFIHLTFSSLYKIYIFHCLETFNDQKYFVNVKIKRIRKKKIAFKTTLQTSNVVWKGSKLVHIL